MRNTRAVNNIALVLVLSDKHRHLVRILLPMGVIYGPCFHRSLQLAQISGRGGPVPPPLAIDPRGVRGV